MPSLVIHDPFLTFANHVLIDDASKCWEWTGHKSHGYGRFGARKRRTLAHRFSWEWFNGPIPDGLTIDHLCRNKSCVNPAHLEPVTAAENLSRAGRAKTSCKHGHEFTDATTYLHKGKRYCRPCRLKTQHRYLERAS